MFVLFNDILLYSSPSYMIFLPAGAINFFWHLNIRKGLASNWPGQQGSRFWQSYRVNHSHSTCLQSALVGNGVKCYEICPLLILTSYVFIGASAAATSICITIDVRDYLFYRCLYRFAVKSVAHIVKVKSGLKRCKHDASIKAPTCENIKHPSKNPCRAC